MSVHTVAVRLKIPDNTAFSALEALRRLGVGVARVERADIWQFEDSGDSGISDAEVAAAVSRNESLFNPNKHVLEILTSPKPRDGETWIREIPGAAVLRAPSAGSHFVSWRLFDESGSPAAASVVREAAEKLLCNPAIETAEFA